MLLAVNEKYKELAIIDMLLQETSINRHIWMIFAHLFVIEYNNFFYYIEYNITF